MLQKRFAYLIGANGPKDQSIKPLQYAEKDVEHLRKALSDRPCEFSDVNNIVATNPSDVLSGLERLATACERSNLLVVHFSGHGKIWGGHLYLICNETQVDAKLFESTAINISRIKNILDLCSAKHKLLILDCCHASTAHSGGAWRGKQELETALQDIKGSVSAILSACASHKRTRELDTLELYFDRGAGFLSWALATVCSVQFAAASREGALSLSDILSWLPGVQGKINQGLRPDEQIPPPRLLHERDIVGDDEIWFTRHRRQHADTSSHDERWQREEYAILNQEPFLRQYCFGAEVDDFDTEKVLEYARKQPDFDRLPKGDMIELCKRLGQTSNLGTPRRSAVLAFHRLPSRYISSALIRVTLRTLDDEIYSIDNIEGSLGEQVERAIQWLIGNLRTISENVGAGKRTDRCEIPEKALRELVVNAILHRDYKANESTQIKITPKQVIITNPGCLNEIIVTSNPPFSYRESHPYNPALLDVLIAQRWAEGRARGFEVVTEEFKKYGLGLPYINNLPSGLVQVIIQRPEIGAIPVQEMTTDENILINIPSESNVASRSATSEVKEWPLWNVPFPRNPYFIGREDILERLEKTLKAGQAATLTQAISGLGGIGKTQLALEYAYRHHQDYEAIFWMQANSREELISGFAALAHMLKLPEKEDTDQVAVVQTVQRWLHTHNKWLLVLDNADDLAMVEEFLPSTSEGRVILTTRAQTIGRLAQPLLVDSLSTDQGALFLLRRARLLASDATLESASPDDVAIARELTIELGGLPLALDQAGAYIEGMACSLGDYQRLYRIHHAELLQERGDFAQDHPHSVTTTLSLAFQKVEQANPAAADLLRVCAFLHPDAIPEEIITQGAAYLSSPLEQIADDQLALDKAITTLRAYSLVHRDREAHALAIHRLVQVVLKDAMSEQMYQQWAERTVLAVNAAFPDVRYEVWSQCERLLPHAIICAAYITEMQMSNPGVAHLLTQAGNYLKERARYVEAEPFLQRALSIREQMLGQQHPETASSLNNLAELYHIQGKYEQAEPFLQRALSIREQMLGQQHPETASSLNNLAELYHIQGKYEQAEPLYLRALHVWEQAVGPEHLEVAYPLTNLAILYREQGKYEQAEPLYLRALHVWEQAVGPEHPEVAYSLTNLAILYREQGKYEQAEPLFQQAMGIWEQALGAEHPEVAYSLTNLAILYREQGKYEQAEPLFMRALSIREHRIGSQHSETASSLSELAHLYQEQGKYAEAEPLYLRALHIWEQAVGPEHPNVASSLSGLAHLYQEQGKYAEAEPLYLQALHIWEQAVGSQHSRTTETRNHYAQLLREIGRLKEAVALEAVTRTDSSIEKRNLVTLEKYFEENRNALYEHALVMTGNRDKPDTEDFLQNTYHLAYKRIQSNPREAIDDMGSWLRDIMHERKKARDLDLYIQEHGADLSKHARSLANELYSTTAKKQEYAEDLLHEAIVHYLRDVRNHPRRIIGDMGKWLYVVMENTHKHNVRLMNLRGKVTSVSLEADPIDTPDIESEQPEEVLINVATQAEIQALLAQLDPRDQEIMALYFEGFDSAEIAARLKKSLNVVNARRKRCRPKLLGLFTPKQLKYFFDKSTTSRRRMEKAIMQSPFSILESRVMSLYVLQGLDYLEIARELNESYEGVKSIVEKRKLLLFKSFYATVAK